MKNKKFLKVVKKINNKDPYNMYIYIYIIERERGGKS
jgi:hypothetical protein